MNTCPVMYDLNSHLTLIDKSDALDEQVDSELIDGDHVGVSIDHLSNISEAALKQLMEYIQSDVIAPRVSLGAEFDAWADGIRAEVKEQIKNRNY